MTALWSVSWGAFGLQKPDGKNGDIVGSEKATIPEHQKRSLDYLGDGITIILEFPKKFSLAAM